MPPLMMSLLPGTPGLVALAYQVKLTEVSLTRKNGAGAAMGGAFTCMSAAKAEPAKVVPAKATASAVEVKSDVFLVDIKTPQGWNPVSCLTRGHIGEGRPADEALF